MVVRILASRAVIGLAIATIGYFIVAFTTFVATFRPFAAAVVQPNHVHGLTKSELHAATYKHHCHTGNKLPTLDYTH